MFFGPRAATPEQVSTKMEALATALEQCPPQPAKCMPPTTFDAPAQSTQQTIQVTVPGGVGPGELVNFNFGCQLMTVTVPPGCHPSMTFDAQTCDTTHPRKKAKVEIVPELAAAHTEIAALKAKLALIFKVVNT